MRVVIVGGGIGGMACAQGLARRGLEVSVIERDTDLRATGGYKLHLGPEALAALRELLPPELVEALYGSAVATRGFHLAVRDHRGRLLVRVREPAGPRRGRPDEPEVSLDVDRVTLRRVLAEDLGDRLRLGRSCRGWHRDGEVVVAELDDGSRLRADVLVVADGPDSPLAARLAGRPTSAPTGLVGVAGRSPWHGLPAPTRRLLEHEPLLAVGPGGTGLFASAHDPVGRAAVHSARCLAATTEPSAIWGLTAVGTALPEGVTRAGHEDLVAWSTEVLVRRHWTETLTGLLQASTPGTAAAFRLHAADPDDLAPWAAGRVTALGDAVHAMPPTGGQGAATAILDARALVERLHAASRGQTTTVMAVHDYEIQLRGHAAPAVRESLQPLEWIRATSSPLGARLMRGALPVVAAAGTAARVLRLREQG